MEVMGLLLGEFVDDYTIVVKDVFAMPQSGSSVSVEAVDPVFQQEMVEALKQTGRYAPMCAGGDTAVFFVHGRRWTRVFDRVWERSFRAGKRLWWAGITRIRALAAGCRVSISTRSRYPSRGTWRCSFPFR